MANHEPAPPAPDPSPAERERIRQASIAATLRACEPVVEDLRAAGWNVTYVEDLYNRPVKMEYRAAMPILLKWLPLVRDKTAKWMIIGALTQPWAKPAAAAPLIREFRADPSVRWEIAGALTHLADKSVLDDIIELAKDPANGRSLDMLTLCLGAIKDPRSVATVAMLLQDEETYIAAIEAAGKLGATELRCLVEPYLVHQLAPVRRQARKAIERIDKASARRARHSQATP
jgi:hypothetical protein